MHFPVGSPLIQVYSRGNLFISHLAEAGGYHSVFLGNNEYFHGVPAFSRFSNQGDPATGTYDSVTRLPDLMKRYHDERVFLLYYVTSPHGGSHTPRRLFEDLGCGELGGGDKVRCSYDARVRHADESLAALQDALHENELDGETLQVITADHGELFGDGFPLEAETVSFQTGTFMGWWDAVDQGHGETCHWNEVHVPLVLTGPDIEPANWDRSISSLDVVPTLGELLDLPIVNALDGTVLPLIGRRATEPARRFVSYGFCSDSIIQREEQLIWWLGKCRLQTKEQGKPLIHLTEQWRLGDTITRDDLPPEDLEREMARHESWIRSRLPSGAHIFDLSSLGSGRLHITTEDGEIVDYGPSSTVYGIGAIRDVAVEEGGRRLTMDFENFRGLFYVATSPPLTPITIDLETPDGGPAPLTFIGPLQLPLDVWGQSLNPRQDPSLFIADERPRQRTTTHPAIRYWWQPFSTALAAGQDEHENMDFDRVLREWGYIR
jgi:hypothetical protein